MRTLLLFFVSVSLWAATLSIDCGSATDQFFTGGAAFTNVTPGATGDLTVRYGTFAYDIPATGPQVVKIVFRETGTVTAANQRLFTVKFNEEAVATNWDLFAAAGLGAVERQFIRMPSAGFINLSFSYTKKSAVVASIEVTPLWDLAPPAPAPPPAPIATSFPAVAEWFSCKSGEVLAGPIGPGAPPGSLWPGLKKVSDDVTQDNTRNGSGYLPYSCDGLEYYRFKLGDGTVTGPYVAVKMPDEFAPDPAMWVKQ